LDQGKDDMIGMDMSGKFVKVCVWCYW